MQRKTFQTMVMVIFWSSTVFQYRFDLDIHYNQLFIRVASLTARGLKIGWGHNLVPSSLSGNEILAKQSKTALVQLCLVFYFGFYISSRIVALTLIYKSVANPPITLYLRLQTILALQFEIWIWWFSNCFY